MKKHTDIKKFREKYGTTNLCLRALLEFRMSPDRLCFNPECYAPIDKYYHLLKGRKAFICSRCLKPIHPMAESFFDHSKLKPEDWMEVLFFILSSRGGISATFIKNHFGFSYPTAFRMLHTIRRLMGGCLVFDLEGTVVEVDESYVKTGTKGLGRHYKFATGRGSLRHTSILSITERGGVAKLIVIPSTDADSIIPVILENVPKSTIIHTDSWGAYNKLKELGYEHCVVNHSVEFVDQDADSSTIPSTNTSENLFSNLKRMIAGTYRSVSDAYLQHYCWEQAFRHSFRFEEDYGFEILMKKSLRSLSETYGEKKQAA